LRKLSKQPSTLKIRFNMDNKNTHQKTRLLPSQQVQDSAIKAMDKTIPSNRSSKIRIRQPDNRRNSPEAILHQIHHDHATSRRNTVDTVIFGITQHQNAESETIPALYTGDHPIHTQNAVPSTGDLNS
jgi:hypothetical protein